MTRQSSNDVELGSNDRVRQSRPVRGLVQALVSLIILSGLAYGGYWAWQNWTPQGFIVQPERLTVSVVSQGQFNDIIPGRATVIPISTTYLDVVEGGRVEEKFVDAGVVLEVGDPIVRLSNTQLQLEAIRSEAQVAEQINNLRNTELAIRRNTLDFERQLAEIDFNLARLERLKERQERLNTQGNVPVATLEETTDEFDFQTALRVLTIDSQDIDQRVRTAQLNQLSQSIERLERNLTIAQSRISELDLSAPTGGQLAFLDAELGELIQPGGRIGQIDDISDFKLTAQLDEFFLSRLEIGLLGSADIDGQVHDIQVSRIFPRVVNGRFEIEMNFDGPAPEAVRRGQTVSFRLNLGTTEDTVILENGPFFQDTNGSWVFVMNSDDSFAMRRNVRLGRRTRDQIEVLNGLEPGDRVIISSYGSYLDQDRLDLRQETDTQP